RAHMPKKNVAMPTLTKINGSPKTNFALSPHNRLKPAHNSNPLPHNNLSCVKSRSLILTYDEADPKVLFANNQHHANHPSTQPSSPKPIANQVKLENQRVDDQLAAASV